MEIAWVILSDRVRERALADRTAVNIARAVSGSEQEPPDPEAEVEAFAEALASEPRHISAIESKIREAWGVSW